MSVCARVCVTRGRRTRALQPYSVSLTVLPRDSRRGHARHAQACVTFRKSRESRDGVSGTSREDGTTAESGARDPCAGGTGERGVGDGFGFSRARVFSSIVFAESRGFDERRVNVTEIRGVPDGR